MSSWVWEAHWIPFVDNHMEQDNMTCWGHTRKGMLTGVPLAFVLGFAGRSRSKSWDIIRSWTVCSVVDSWSFRVWFASVPYQIPADPKYCPDIGSLLWTYFATSCYAMLVAGSRFWPWPQRRSSGNLNILLVQCGIPSCVCESLWRWQKKLARMVKASREALKLKDAKVYLKLAIPSTFMTW